MKAFYFLLFFFTMISCNNPVDANYVKSKMWSYNGGFKVGQGDFITFDDTKIFDLRGDTIYYNNNPRAIIKSVDKKNFTMKLSSLNGKEIGTYRNTEESLE